MAEWAADTARDQLAVLGIGAPHATTLGRVFERLDADVLDRLAGAWAQAATALSAVALDGKEVRGAKNGGGTRVHLMAAIDHGTGAVLGQVSGAEKSNEIPYFSTLLRRHYGSCRGWSFQRTHSIPSANMPTTFIAEVPSTCSPSRESAWSAQAMRRVALESSQDREQDR